MKLRYGDPTEVGMSGERVRRLVDRARSWVDAGMTPALAVLVARKGVIVLHAAFGKLTPADDSPPLPRDAIFPISSITKPFTATAAMVLVDDGLLGLNRPVQEYLPEFVGDGKDPGMIHHLLTHFPIAPARRCPMAATTSDFSPRSLPGWVVAALPT